MSQKLGVALCVSFRILYVSIWLSINCKVTYGMDEWRFIDTHPACIPQEMWVAANTFTNYMQNMQKTIRVRPCIRPLPRWTTNKLTFHLAVCPDEFSVKHGWNGLKFDMVMFSSELIRFWSRSVDLCNLGYNFDFVKCVKFRVSWHFRENAWKEWLEISHGDMRYILTTFRTG